MKKSADKILIFGNGQIGNFYLNFFNNDTKHKAFMSHANITKIEELENDFEKYKPTVVINAAGKTNLEWAKENKQEAFRINVLGADNVAKMADKHNVYHIYLSSGCIFESKDTKDIKTEESIPNPQSYYSWTKVWAENMIMWEKSDKFKGLILRLRQPVSTQINHKNMLIKLLTFTQYVDTPNTGTILEDLMVWTNELIEKRYTGILNAANDGWSTPYNIAHLLKKYVLPELEINKITKEELNKNTPAIRVDAILDVSKLKTQVSEVRKYEDALEELIKELAHNFKEEDKEKIEKELTITYEQTKQRAKPNNVWKNLFEK